ncbi:uncharacterized protein LOC111267172 isoform X2 [Varroa jacobsoni]|uniref:uncharacterized protein LOC111267172 isoform X2 n=1 Tax=Varroa jacobsoni TaxID=62625 RepID=UPI000BF58312|nr:uncharacterized protein LOC111267172 isoform X2 [Varroa jacobsoni]XP_022700973.1 uncharacterized protein LOC111267172 isoform X2 [Varroa jacobsoni]
MPRENTCVICGVRSDRCMPFTPRRTVPRNGWLQALALKHEGPRPRGGNYVCRDHFGDEDFDQDGNLCPNAIPQSMGFSSHSVGESNSEDGELEDSYTKAFHLFAPSVKQEKVELDLGQSPSGHFSHVSQPGTSYTLGHTVVDASRIHQDPHAWQVKQESYDAALEHDQTMPPHASEYAYVRAVCSRPVSCSHNGRHAVSSAAGVVSGSVSGAVATCSATFTEPQSSAAQNSQVSNSSTDNDCPVCLQPFSHPIKLPCSHVFCYLCAKGFASQHGRCAFCRATIPPGYMELPVLVPEQHHYRPKSNVDSKFVWYYEGRNGWWQFEERHSDEIEEALHRGESEHELQIAGFIYVVDMQNMVQFRKDHLSRTRRIKRDLLTAPRKGIAGLREDLINGTML